MPKHPATATAAAPAPASSGASKTQKVRHLLQLTGAEDSSRQVMETMLQQFERTPGLPPGYIQKFRELAMQGDLISMIVPVYEEHLSEEDLDRAIAFYETPSGHRIIQAQPAILQESMAIGKQWGRDLSEKTFKALREEKDRERNTQ